MKPVKHLALILILSAAVVSFAASPAFDADAYMRHVRFLAGDELRGRGNGTPELDRAAEYIAGQFQSSGLLPGGDGGTYFQKFMLTTGSETGPGNRLTLRLGEQAVEAGLYEDFAPFGISDKSEIEGEIVFAGYGITAAEFDYDDYRNLDVTDKIVLVLAHEPREKQTGEAFNGTEPTLHGHDNTKAVNAKYRNARAVFVVQDPANHPEGESDWPALRRGTEVDELGINSVRISRGLADRILKTQQKSLLELQKAIDGNLAPQSFVLTGVRARLVMDVTRIRREVRNVIGVLPGASPAVADETVILGAHYDHLGLGGRNSMLPQLVGTIHNGADDNASGTAGLIELAASFGREKMPRKRSYLFIAFAGEELGLHGSAYWVSHPTRSLDKVVAMLNMDMIGRSRENRVDLGGVGTSPLFPDLVNAAGVEAKIQVRTSRSGYGSSDHQSFYMKDIPVLFFFSGLHSDYHRPSDDWDKINAEGATKILRMVHTIASRLNSLEQRPQFTKVDEPAVTGTTRGGGSGYGTYFGSIPDMTDEVTGVRFADIRPNSPAAKAGVRAKDILVRFAGKEIQNLQDFTYMLRTHKPGDTVEVVVLREGQPLTLQVTLDIRRE